MSSLFSLCLVLLTSLAVAIILSLRQSPPHNTAIHQYLTNYTILSTIIEEQAQRNRTITNLISERKKQALERKNEKFDKMIKQMKKEKKDVDNKYFRRNKKIRAIFSKRLGKIKEYCARYKKGQTRGIRGIKPRATTKSFSLGE